MSEFRKNLENPSNEYRSLPFWAWNEKMEPERIREQIDKMCEQHMGGFFIHSREGLETEYLSDEWMKCVGEAIKYGREKGLEVWLYDEDKWPSGMAGGAVVKNCPQHRAKALTLHIDENGERFYWVEETADSEWYNGYSPADNLSSASVGEFINTTHAQYEKKTESFEAVKGFFTDEPNVCDFFSKYSDGCPWLPWTEGFEAYFEKKRGYNIEGHLDDLFYDTPSAAKTRHDYCKTISELFDESYFKQIADWLKARGMEFTGHLIFENDFGYSSRTGGSVMPHYRHFDKPGIDILGAQDEEILTVKQCTSVANQFGKKHVVTETYGCTKWDFGLKGQKWLCDWQFIMGVTRRCQHLYMYSIKGLRKRDYPPVFSPQTTLWEESHVLEDYFARFAVCSTYGKVIRNILVIHPQSSAWLTAGSRSWEDLSHWDDNMGWTDEHFLEGNKLGAQFSRLVDGLVKCHRDCDLGDEMLIEKFGSCENGKFIIEKAAYGIVVVPRVKNLFSSTLKLLEQFVSEGGVLITIGNPPEYIDGELRDDAKALFNSRCVHSFDSELAALSYVCKISNDITVENSHCTEEADILTMYREIPEGKMLICTNHSMDNCHEIKIGIKGKGNIEKLNLMDGGTENMPAHYDEKSDKMSFVDRLSAVETAVYILNSGAEWEEKEPSFTYRHPHAAKNVWKVLSRKAPVTRELPNVLPLDNCSYKYADAKSEVMPVWQAQRELRSRLEMRPNWYNGAVQRYMWINNSHKNDGTYAEFIFEFNVKDVPVGNLKLAVEDIELYTIELNGTDIYSAGDKTSGEYYLDHSLKTVVMPTELIKSGKNTLILKTDYTERQEFENIYILGDFAVNMNREIEPEEGYLSVGDMCMQGYPFYGGGITYHYEVEAGDECAPGDGDANEDVVKDDTAAAGSSLRSSLTLNIDDFRAAAAEVYVNGINAGMADFAGAKGLKIGKYLKPGKNNIDIKLILSPRNIFGPFHLNYETCIRSSYADFCTEGDRYTPEYILNPQGIMGAVTLLLS